MTSSARLVERCSIASCNVCAISAAKELRISKTFVFGWLIGAVGCYMGLTTRGGTVGVGRATTRAVVIASISVFVTDFFLTKLFLML